MTDDNWCTVAGCLEENTDSIEFGISVKDFDGKSLGNRRKSIKHEGCYGNFENLDI